LTSKNKLIALIAYLLVLAVAVFGYRTNRAAKVKRLRSELSVITAEQNKTRSSEKELARLSHLIPAEANTPAFIESLYRYAHESGLKQHEAMTESGASTTSARPGAADTGSVAKQRIKISAIGSYRNFAEYLRRVQNIERFNRVTEFTLAPEAGQLKGSIIVELYYLPVKHDK
jgi:Tfp pilus assembly protein PilO